MISFPPIHRNALAATYRQQGRGGSGIIEPGGILFPLQTFYRIHHRCPDHFKTNRQQSNTYCQ